MASAIGYRNRGVPQNFFARFAVGVAPKNRYILEFFRGYRKTASENAGQAAALLRTLKIHNRPTDHNCTTDL